MNGIEIGLISAGLGINFLLGSLYAIAVRYGSAHGYTDGYTALLVVIGVGFTLAINQLFLYIPDDQLLDGVWAVSGFAASGGPMVFEYFMRRANQRRKEEASDRDSSEVAKEL